ncbi:MAG: cupredoxin domain-containing protein [Chloroflexi bacterium]|nr:cupredoxin domain-containing protein [Chloroflexota bacterium]
MPKNATDVRTLMQTRLSRRTVLVGAVMAAVGTAVVSCAGGSAATPAATTAPLAAGETPGTTKGVAQNGGAAVVVTMNDQYRYVPETVTIKRGQTIEWRNTSASTHTITDDPSKAQDKSHAILPSGAQPWDSGNIDPGKSFTLTLTVPGDYTYFCIPHESMGMIGKITVT